MSKDANDIAEEYISSLSDLTVNSKPLINMLTMLAEDCIEHAPVIVKAVETHLQKVQGDIKLPVLYLIDSIVKNVKKDYIPLFTQNIVSTFCSVFQKVDEQVKSQMFKLRQTWNDIFPPKKLYALDARVNAMDPAWPIAPVPKAARIHVNPKFFQNQQTIAAATPPEAVISSSENAIQEELLKQRKELLELQKKKVELELIQTKAILEERQKKIETQTAAMIMKSDSPAASSSLEALPAKQPRIKYPKEMKNQSERDKPTNAGVASFRSRDPRIRIKESSEKSSSAVKSTTTPPSIKIPKFSDKNSSSLSPSNKSSPSKSKKEKRTSKKSRQDNSSESPRKDRSKKDSKSDLAKSNNENSHSEVQVTQEPPEKHKSDVLKESDNFDVIELDISSDNSTPPQRSPLKMKRIPKRKRPEKRKHNRTDSPLLQIAEPEPLICDNLPVANKSKDVDLRLLSAPAKTLSDTDSKALDSLFGPEDVDLRTFPVQPPTPPPPPIISRSDKMLTDSTHHQNSGNWANLKGTKRDDSSYHKKQKSTPDRFGRIFHQNDAYDSENNEDGTVDERTSENCNLIIQQAEEQLNSGNISFTEYNNMLKAVMKMNEERKLQDAMRQDMKEFGLDDDDQSSIDKGDESSGFKRKHEGSYNGEEYLDDSSKDARKRSKFDAKKTRFGSRFDYSTRDRGMQRTRSLRRWDPRSDYKTRSHPSRQIFDQNKVPYRYRGSMSGVPPPPPPPTINPFGNSRVSGVSQNQLPPADPHVLDLIAQDSMKNIVFDGVPREVRFYGDTAIVLLAWDDPREVSFQPGSKSLIIDEREAITLQFNAPYMEFIVDGVRVNIRLGAPTRELYIDGMFFEVVFGAPPIQVMFGGRMHSICMPGPTPSVKFSSHKRTDLLAGRINLIVDANNVHPIYLDPKPQRFDINGIPYILRFVEALQTVVINGIPFKIEFGGTPVPIFCQGEKHYLRLSVLPHGIVPGQIEIFNMEGSCMSSPPSNSQSLNSHPIPHNDLGVQDNNFQSFGSDAAHGNDHPLELLASLMPSSYTPPTLGQRYSAESGSESQPMLPLPSDGNTITTNTLTTSLPVLGNINVNELLKKLVAVGIVPAANNAKEKESTEDLVSIKPVDFTKPETLKVRQSALIAKLYSGIQCSSCGVRFSPEDTVKYSQHLDWHFRQNRRDKDSTRIAQSRRWHYEVSDWIQYQEIEDVEERAQSWFEIQEKKTTEGEEPTEEEPSVSIDKGNEAFCVVCRDRFDIFYNQEKEEWHLKMAVRVDDKVFHPICYKDYLENPPKDNDEDLAGIFTPQENIEEEETIEIVDDSISENTVLSAQDEQSKENEEDLKTSPDEKIPEESQEAEDEKADPAEDSDDDILHIEVIEPKIESYEILDDDDDEEDNNNDEDEEQEDTEKDQPVLLIDDNDELDVDFSNVVIKQEKDTFLPEPALTSNHTAIISSIDGNVELESAPIMVLPKKININITSSLNRLKTNSQVNTNSVPSKNDQENDETVLSSETFLPSDQITPAFTKPSLLPVKLTHLPPVTKGNELSGLCSLM